VLASSHLPQTMSTAVSTGTVNINIAPPKVPKEHVRVVARFRPVNDRESKLPEQPNEDFSLLIDERQCLVGLNRLLYPKVNLLCKLCVDRIAGGCTWRSLHATYCVCAAT